MLISLFGQSTRLKAPVLTYVREIWQYDTYQKDYINFCAQAPYNASYELYLDPSYDLVTYNRMDYMSNSTAQPETEDAEYEKTEISFGEQKKQGRNFQSAAFALNEFGMQRMETLDEGEGLKGTFHFWDQKISGTVENKTGYDLESCVIAVPGYCALIGDIKNGETITLDGIEADSVRDFGNWSAAEDLPEIEKIIWTASSIITCRTGVTTAFSLESWQAMTIRSSLTADTKRMESRITIRKCLWT